MPACLVIAMAQINPTVGDIEGNLGLIRAARAEAAAAGADLVLLPELCIVGYPPEDLVLKPALTEHAQPTRWSGWRRRRPTAGRR